MVMKTRYILAILAIFVSISVSSCSNGSCCKEGKAKYIFLFIGDGMGNSHVATAESYLSYKQGKLGGEHLLMTTFPYYGTATTYSANRQVTCSSAAGTAIACGEKTKNGMLGMGPDSLALKSVAYELKEQGYKIGILSTVPINHATPASFYAHNISRGSYYEIASEIPQSKFDYFASSGFLAYNGKDGDKEPIDNYLEANGCTVCYGLDEFKEEKENSKTVVLCPIAADGKNVGNYTVEGQEEEDLSLSQMLEAGIELLGDDKPFFFMCEGGDIDWAAHGHKTMAMVMNILEFDEAIQTAYEFYLKHPDETLIIVTADHETGGLSLGSTSKKVNWEMLEKSWIDNGMKPLEDKAENKELNDKCSFGWTTGSHTGAQVPVYAIGCGAERFMGRMDNTDIKDKILSR